MSNGVNSLIITPIAPNSLSFRPICLPSDCEIRIKVIIHLFSYQRKVEAKDMLVMMASLIFCFHKTTKL
jgi:NAD kinase